MVISTNLNIAAFVGTPTPPDPPPAGVLSYFGGEITVTPGVSDVTGQYADGSWWINGTVTAMAPAFEASATRSLLGGGTAVADVHGWMVDPGNASVRAGDMSTLALRQAANYGSGTNALDQAWDGYATGTDASNHQYDASLRPSLPISAGTVVKARSNMGNARTDSRNAVEFMAVVTIVSTAPATGSIRPPMARSDKTPILNVADIDLTKLRNLDAGLLASSPPSFAEVLEWVSSTETWYKTFHTSQQNVTSYNVADSTDQRYMGSIAAEWSQVLLGLHTNAYTTQQKTDLIIQIGKIACDIAARVDEGGIFQANGGHSHGRLPLVVFAAELFNNQYLRDAAAVVAAAKRVNTIAQGISVFGDLSQLFYITQPQIDFSADKTYPFNQSQLGHPQWSADYGVGTIDDVQDVSGNFIANAINGADNLGKTNKISYAGIVGKSLAGFSLAIRLLQGVTPVMPTLYHDWADRWINYEINGASWAVANGYAYLTGATGVDASTANQTPAWVKDAYTQWSSLVTVWSPS